MKNELKEMKKKLRQAENIIRNLCNWYDKLSNVSWQKPLYHKPFLFQQAEQFLEGNIEAEMLHLKEQLEYIDYRIENPINGQTSNTRIKGEMTHNLIAPIIWHCIEDNPDLEDEEKALVHRYFTLICDEFIESKTKEESIQWHDLRKNPEDLPPFDVEVNVYHRWGKVEIGKREKCSLARNCWLWSMCSNRFRYTSDDKNVLAWCEIPEFKEGTAEKEPLERIAGLEEENAKAKEIIAGLIDAIRVISRPGSKLTDIDGFLKPAEDFIQE